jgi:hypothetical protein
MNRVQELCNLKCNLLWSEHVTVNLLTGNMVCGIIMFYKEAMHESIIFWICELQKWNYIFGIKKKNIGLHC